MTPRSAKIALVIAIATLVAVVTSPANARASDVVNGHLYVEAPALRGRYPAPDVRRYQLVDGIPRDDADLSYRDLSGPLAVDNAGNFYALHATENTATLLEYVSGSKTPLRALNLLDPNPPSGYSVAPVYTTIAVDRSGYLYVASIPSSNVYASPARCGWQVEVYAPGARRDDEPVQCLIAGEPYGIGIDRDGNAYIGSTFIAFNAVFVVANPDKSPAIVRTMWGRSFGFEVTSTAIDDEGDLYVLAQPERRADESKIEVYRAAGDGNVEPLRTLDAGSVVWGDAFAVRGSRLYVTAGNQVLVYDKTATGKAAPLATLTFPYGPITYLAVGP
jgi:hypothetical protein